ncbi:DNA-binding GntR family transcriptional regulator [Nocardiopsis mwathae]|uniref:DNA-binding GntR family transcriptional regulator n=1 Tax=Nocardiopsis mwathae TaxID=1472723 RepID=A0A7X0D872_9ACTN|nr:DNA-binding GntR family transcriptional regulator [Nocardiopsis mwathae]
MVELADNRPRWRQVHEIIKERIRSGTYAPGTRIPSVIQLHEEFGIATATGQKVMRALRADGLVYTEPGMGSFVVMQPDAKPDSDQ